MRVSGDRRNRSLAAIDEIAAFAAISPIAASPSRRCGDRLIADCRTAGPAADAADLLEHRRTPRN